jgi:hypothetical protein
MKKNILSLFEAVICSIKCDFCDEEIDGYGEHDVAESADEEGWTVNKKEEVKCPNCKHKRSKK